jgi:hypothetical protein
VISFSEGEDLTAAITGPGVFGWEVDEVTSIIHQIKASVSKVPGTVFSATMVSKAFVTNSK